MSARQVFQLICFLFFFFFWPRCGPFCEIFFASPADQSQGKRGKWPLGMAWPTFFEKKKSLTLKGRRGRTASLSTRPSWSQPIEGKSTKWGLSLPSTSRANHWEALWLLRHDWLVHGSPNGTCWAWTRLLYPRCIFFVTGEFYSPSLGFIHCSLMRYFSKASSGWLAQGGLGVGGSAMIGWFCRA